MAHHHHHRFHPYNSRPTSSSISNTFNDDVNYELPGIVLQNQLRRRLVVRNFVATNYYYRMRASCNNSISTSSINIPFAKQNPSSHVNMAMARRQNLSHRSVPFNTTSTQTLGVSGVYIPRKMPVITIINIVQQRNVMVINPCPMNNIIMNSSSQPAASAERFMVLPNLQRCRGNNVVVGSGSPASDNASADANTTINNPAGFGDHDRDHTLVEEEPQVQLDLSLSL
ncbi:hypothetical protein FNV43_RR03563 [Rhamnella rubrinervis]|uniref:Uncharacterized protein n=1 Tax=Rhamnella rubrinervis TaxID=2594499 RepID=A0A8K0HJ39_9ROSA|nr:hypothetical protein FNV43_RR03563 [Rhamnella rubrinervis]